MPTPLRQCCRRQHHRKQACRGHPPSFLQQPPQRPQRRGWSCLALPQVAAWGPPAPGHLVDWEVHSHLCRQRLVGGCPILHSPAVPEIRSDLDPADPVAPCRHSAAACLLSICCISFYFYCSNLTCHCKLATHADSANTLCAVGHVIKWQHHVWMHAAAVLLLHQQGVVCSNRCMCCFRLMQLT